MIILLYIVPKGLEQADNSHNELEQKLALSLSKSAAIAIFVNNSEIASEVIDALLLHQEIDAVKLESDGGIVFTSNPLLFDESSSTENINRYRLYSPVDAQPIGTLLIHSDSRVLQQRAISRVLYQVGFILVQFLFTVMVLVLVLKKIVGRPLTTLSKALDSATPGHSEIIPINKANENNEIGVVAHSVNTFINNSHQAIERERELRAQIEHWEQHYRHMAEQDSLTGLKNRLGCEKYIEKASLTHQYIALLLMDLDGFKAVNDDFGHAAGDFTLTEIARRFSVELEESNLAGVVGRIGGDEFVIYLALHQNDSAPIQSLAHNIVQSANQPILYQSNLIQVGCSVGIAVHANQQFDIDKLIQHADKAMYSVKQMRKNDFSFYQTMKEESPLP
ncbi:diguanylate cyclase domain-containing protein [Vibrio marinisediminis]|uniref:diguanylate cyclase domain-containing protein n=1 Tax=Vibrio marinisediminis TaxID=2758441 RepID=UPI0034D1A635